MPPQVRGRSRCGSARNPAVTRWSLGRVGGEPQSLARLQLLYLAEGVILLELVHFCDTLRVRANVHEPLLHGIPGWVIKKGP